MDKILQLTVLVGLIYSGSAAATITRKALADVYSKAKTVEIVMTQTKSAEYLLQPLKSKVRFEKKGDHITWESLSPIAFRLEMSAAGAMMPTSQLGAIGDNPAFRAKLKNIGSFLQAVFTADFAVFERDFDLTLKGRQMIAKPKTAAAPLPYTITMTFDSKAHLTALEMVGNGERLDFEVLKFSAD